MTLFRTLTLTSTFALAAGPALAELTPSEVWDDWQELLGRYGAEVTFDRTSNSGDDLSIIGMTARFPVTDGASVMEIGTLTFEQNSDGSVSVVLPDELPLSIEIEGPDGEEGTIGFTFKQPGASLIASGDSENLRYDFDYPTVEMTDFTIEGDDIPEDIPVTFTFAMSALKGFIELAGDDVRSYTSDSSLGELVLNMDINGETPEEGDGTFNLSMKDLVQSTTGTIGRVSGEMTLAELIEAGTRQVGTGTHGEVTYELDVNSPDGSFQMAAAAVSGTINGRIDEGGIAYGGETNDVTMSFSASAMPLPPVSFRMAQSSGSLAIPLVPGEDPQGFQMGFAIRGLEIDDMLWGMIDPVGQLPRDPITILLSTDGQVTISDDFLDQDFLEDDSPDIPGTIESLNVNEMQITIAGADLTGNAAFEFDNSVGMPMPAGIANLRLVGGNGLLDTLVGMGLVPEEQAMGARMMLGLFARPGEGEDTLESVIEMKEDGSITANGQRIR